MLKARIKTWITVLIAVFSMALFYGSPATGASGPSQSSDKDSQIQLLTKITDNTYWIWFYLNEFFLAWINPDTTSSTAQIQQDFTNYMNYTWQNQSDQITLQAQSNGPLLASHFFGKTLPANVNQLSYTTVLGAPLNGDSSNLQSDIQNYVINAAALNITHYSPSKVNGNNAAAVAAYTNFYNTITAVQSYSAYILGDIIVNYQNLNDPNNHFKLSVLQENLKNEASSPTWFTQIASENIGLVLRQLLMFQSQTYILMLQMVESQKQQLALSAMSNSLVVLGNQFNENELLGKATGAIR